MPVASARVRPVTVAGLLRVRAAESPGREAYLFLADGEVQGDRLTWGELDLRARTIAHALRASSASLRPGDRALLLYPPGLDFVAAFFGCLYAGVVAVPAYPPRPHDRSLERLRAVARDAEPRAALTTGSILANVSAEGWADLAGRAPELAAARWIATDTLRTGQTEPEDWEERESPEDVAFLQYTSGSTSTPKGVMVTHANLLHNEAAIGAAFRQDADSVVVGWLPLYHDMGLIGNVLQPLHAGSRCVLMAPAAFLQRPRRWLEAIGRYRGTTSGGPNFAYELCVRRIPPEQREGLDLRSWRLAFNGAEPVRADTLARFAEAFAPCGFDPAAFYPCYGLAEATLFVSGGGDRDRGRLPRIEPVIPVMGARPLVSCGHAWGGQRIAIVDPVNPVDPVDPVDLETGAERMPGAEGEIWVAGPSVAAGYWRNPEATERDFRARLVTGEGPFLRTGDLGVLVDGELFVTGRIKDLVILRGRNHYPQDLERTAEAAHPELRPGGAAAFAVEDEGGEERLVIVAEVERRRRAGLATIAEAVRRAVAEEHEVQAGEVVLVRPGGVPKTSSGKVRRSACRAAWQAGELPVLERSGIATAAGDRDGGADGGLDAAGLAALPAEERGGAIERFLRSRAAAALGIAAAAIDPERPLTAYGFDSLAALELKGSAEAALGLSLPLRELLAGAGTARLAESLTPRPPLPSPPLPPGEGGQGGEVSFGEQALWFLERLAPAAGAYNIAVAARVHGDLDGAALRRAFAALTDRHEALRTVFPLVGDAPVRRVLPVGSAAVDFRTRGGEDGKTLGEVLSAQAWRPFDLAAGPLVRVRLVDGGAEGSVLLLCIHHLVADFWSLAVVARDLAALYSADAADAADAGLSGLPVGASDFARWQAEMLGSARGEALWESWREALAGLPDLDLPTDRPRPPVQTWRGASRAAVLPAEEAMAVRALAAGQGATLFTALLAAFQAQLGRYAGQPDFAVGTPTAGRSAPVWEGVVGYLVNPVALRADLAGHPGFGEVLARVRTGAVAALEGADFPFALLAERLRPSRDPARPPIFQTMLALNSQRLGDPPGLAAFALGEDGARLAFAGLELESVRLAERRAQFEISLSAAELPDGGVGGIGLSIEVNADLFDPATAERMLGHFRTLLAAAVADPARPVDLLPLLTPAERDQLAAEWESAAPAVAVPPLTLHQAFAQVAARTPEAAALEVEGEEGILTYRELAARSAALAARLRAMGVGLEMTVALCVERSADLVVGLLGILEAGGVYLPLDPEHSAARLGFVLGDAGAAALVIRRSLAGWLQGEEPSVPLLFLDEPDGIEARALPAIRSLSTALPANAAYLIYTSGSTGRPKGVAVSHGAAFAHCLTWADAYRLRAGDRVLQFASPGFDASIEQVFATLLAGATLVLRGREPWGTGALTRRLAGLRLTVADLPTAFWSGWIADVATDAANPGDTVPPGLRLVGIGGEELRAETARLWRATPLSRVPLLNSYGPTEAVISATLYAVPPVEDGSGRVPIGRSLAGRVARVLGRSGEPQPVGVPGELCLGGVLARGYLGRPDLTAERFVPDPFAAAPGERLYRSGDRARRRPGGEIELLGRFDDQVKVRGFRIEPGEIEAALGGHPEVRAAAVLALGAAGSDERRLAAFVVPRTGDRLPDGVRAFLGERLPGYMVPSAWVALPALPLNPNGKVDRAALARLAPEAVSEGKAIEEEGATEAPRTPLEEILAGLFAELLGRERVGVHDDFFALGGHSLLATRAVSRIGRLLGVDLPVSALFQTPTVAALAERAGLLAAAGVESPVQSPIQRLPRGAGTPLPLSFAQQRLWFLDRLEPGTAVYNLPGAVDLAGPLAVSALAAALSALVARHEPLRTVYAVQGGEPVQRIEPPALQDLPVIDLSGLAPALREAEADRQGRREARAPFDLARGPVCRTVLLRLAPREHRLLVTLHHIAADGWSLGLFLDELAALLEDRDTRPLPALPVQYADWAAWQRAWMEGGELASQLAWWRERLAGLPVLDLPADRTRPAVRDPRGGSRSLALPPELAAGVARLARQAGCTAFMVLLGAFQALLARITGEDAIPVGAPVANRRRGEAEPLIGLFVNTLVLAVRTGDDPELGALLARVREACLGAYAHQDVPFERLVQELQPERDLGQNPLFQVMFVLDEPLPPRRAGGLALTPRRAGSGTSRFDLMLAVTPGADGGWTVLTEHAAALFEAVTIDRLLGHFATLLAGAVAAPGARLADLPLLAEAERAQLAEWNDSPHPLGGSLGLHELVAAQAARTPGAEAVVGEEERITYGELMARAGRVAHALRGLGVGPEARIGLCLRRTPDLLAAILGILAAGGAYVPLDPGYPQERLDFMLSDSGAGVLWTERALADRFGFFRGVTVLADEAVQPGALPRAEEARAFGPSPARDSGPRLAYVIYTSGSTGRPKGVGIEHRSAVALVRWALGVFPPEDLRGVLAATSVCFDLSIFEFFVPLAAGGRVILAPGVLELPQLAALGEVTLVNAVPSPMAELVRGRLPAGLRTVNLAGEALKPDLVERIYAHPQVERVVNLYGPSEDTTYSTWTVVPRGAAVTIGRPIAGTQAWVLGRWGEALPVGVPGELCLGGAGLARGYLGRPELTAEKFVPDPFGGEGARLYRTGDRARLQADGEIEFLGRFDHQVKLRGQRIELGEIEVALESCPAVAEAVVMLRADRAGDDARLVGYVVPAREAPSVAEVAEGYLRERLPPAIVPSVWVVLDAFPRSPNGKVDRRALPAPQAPERGEETAPRTPLEERLAGIWREVLGVERLGVHDNFFALGGHSLLAVRMAFRVAEALGLDVPVTAVFAAPTVAEMAAWLAQAAPSVAVSAQEAAEGPFPLSFAQQRLWFLDLLEPGSALYNLSIPMRFAGRLDVPRLGRALAAIVRRHEPLRTVYSGDGEGEPVQIVLPAEEMWSERPLLSRVSLAALPEPARGAAAQALLAEQAALPFDLRNGPVARFVLVEVRDEEHLLAATFHHIAADGWSLGIFSRELAALYEGLPLPELPVRYVDSARAERRALESGALDGQLDVWRRELAGIPVLELPADRPRPQRPSSRGAARRLDLPAGLGRGPQTAGLTPFMVLLAGLAALLGRLSGQDDFGIGVPVAGRNRVETEGLIGLFVNTLVLRNRLDGDPAFLELARRVRDTAVAAQASQDVPFEKLVEELQPERASGASPFFRVLFAFLSDPAAALRIPGLDVSLVDVDATEAKLDLTLSIHDWEGRLEGSLGYRTDLFDAATVDRLAGHLGTLLAGAAADPARRLSDLPLLREAERWQIEGEWTATGRSFGPDRCLHELVEAQVARTPDAPAVVSEAGTLSYRELDARAEALAGRLRSLGVGPEVAVGLHVERSADFVIGALGVLKAGGAWLPLDPDYPAERLSFLLEAARAPVVLTQSHLAATLPPSPAYAVRLDAPEDWAAPHLQPLSHTPSPRPGEGGGLEIDSRRDVPLSRAAGGGWERGPGGEGPKSARLSPDNLACLFFTSGSTGRPKGVMVPHRGLVNRLLAAQEMYGAGPADTALLKAASGFDFSVWECFGPLIAGARLVVARPGGHRDAGYLVRAIAEHGVTLVHFVPSMLSVFLGEEGVERCVSLRQVFAGGEQLTPGLRERFFERLSIPLDNQYGPTEISIDMTRWVCAPGQDPRRVPIGRPIANTRLALLDRALRPVPVGVTGEICVSGVGVTRGYLGRPDLTAERFLPDVLGDGGGRMYRTGDLGRWLPDGTVEFLGRADQQVKVRGVRIEPAEVEAALLRHPAVAAAAVVADPQGSRLIAYWVARPEPPAPAPAELRTALRASLPETMLPALFVRLEELPLTPNGKLDRRALPVPEAAAMADTERGGPAEGDEELLAELWSGLLGVERIGAGDNFFDLGGHSLLATQLISRVRAAFGIDLPLAAVFEAPSLGELARRLQEARRARDGAPALPPPAREGGTEAPLSFSQQRLWFLHQLEPDSAAYHVLGALRLTGPLRPEVLARSLAGIAGRHEVLRTVFAERAGGPVQVVLPPAAPAALPVLDLASLPPPDREAEALRLLAREDDRPFDLTRGPLLRTELLRLGAGEHLLAVVMHHIVSDAWSLGILLRELTAFYNAFAAGVPENDADTALPELAIQYSDFARWQRRWLTGGVLERELAHWRGVLAGAPEVQELPYDRPRPAVATQGGGRRPFALSGDRLAALRALGRREGWTLFMTLLAAFQALLTRLSGQEDAVVGSPVANRNRLETEGLIGFFTNTLALRLDLSGDPAFREIGRRARAVALDAYSHEDLPFEKLVEELAPERHPGLNPLFQVMLVVQRPPDEALALPGVTAELLDVESGVAKFDLTLFLFEEAEGLSGLSGMMEHSRDLFDPATVDRMLASFGTLLEGAVTSPGLRLSELPLLAAAEREELMAWTRPRVPRPPHPTARCVHEMVAEQAALHPEADAVVSGEARLSFRELLERSRRLARRLAALGVGPDVPVGISLERSPEMLVALLAVLEAGGAYLPLDPSYPRERLRLMLEDAGAQVVLTDGAGALPSGVGTVVRVDGEAPGGEDGPLASGVVPENLVYVVYTSGSTGRPKGVGMTHAAISAMLAWQLRTSAAGSGRTLQLASLSFDVSFQEIFSAWAAGGAVVLVSEDVRRDPPALLELLAEERVGRLFLPFVALQQLAVAADTGVDGRLPASLREVMSAGEQLYVTPQVAGMFSRLPGSALYNHYGPSETHAATWLTLTGDPAGWPERPSIGVPLDHARVFLLDRWRQPVPAGVPGEIWVGGAGLARGYLARPDLTAERFAPDPFAEVAGWQPGDRLYRTGDLARRLPDGTLEYLGRGDAQVKVRGQRIEPAEVETALARHPAVLQAAVAVRGGVPDAGGAGARRLVAYVVFREGVPAPAFAEVKAFLAESLPDPMIPSAWAHLDALPLTPSGKLDRRALAHIAPEESHHAFAPPRTPAEEILAGIWRDVLGVERVGRRDDFFELGGHSLLATQVASRLREAFRVELPLRRLFEAPTLEGMAAAAVAEVEAAGAGGEAQAPPPIRRAPRAPEDVADLPLSFAQERLWFLDRLQPGAAYDIPLALRATGRLDVAALAAALGEIVRRHEVLRTVYDDRGGSPVQIVLPAAGQRLPVVDLAGLRAREQRAEAARLAAAEASWVFDLTAGPLLRTVLVALGPAEHLLLVNMHHIVSDGWSLGVLVRELKALYAAALRGEPSPLPELALQYADFARWQRDWLAGAVLERQLAWWRERLAGAPAALEIPADRPRPPVQSGRGAEHRFTLGVGARDLAHRLTALGRQEGATPFMVLAAGLFALLARRTGQRDLVIGSPIANRNRLETEGLIGFFVNTLALRADLSRAASFRDLLRQVREASLGAYAHQDLPFEKLVEELHPDRDLSRSPLFQVAVALQNAPLPTAELDGLTLAPVELPAAVAKLDLSFVLDESFAATLQYATDLFDAPTAARLAGHLEILLAGATAEPRARLAELPLLSAAERHQVVAEWNDTREQVVGGALLHQLFEAQADRRPDALAVVGGESALTYGALDAAAERLAHLLRGLGVGPGEAAGIWMERSADMITAVLAVLKAGGTYVPLDPAWPAERAEVTLAATGARAVLTRSALLPAVQEIEWRLPRLTDAVCLDVLEPVPPPEPLDPESVRALWDYVAESAEASDVVTAGGFISSFTGRPFSLAEVEEYRERVLSLAAPCLRPLRPEARVLEIGCGAGLILWEMAERAGFCAGLDPSPRTQERNREHARAAGITNVELAVGFAHEAGAIYAGERFDLIVLASTVQFFPGPLYLERVVEEALRLLAPGGALLIADVPDARRQAELRRALAAAGAPAKTGQARELWLDEDLFRDVAAALPGAGEVSVLHRREGFANELGFRYDVVIGKDEKDTKDCKGPKERRKRLWTGWHAARQSAERTAAAGGPEGIAYVIHTSGSTGAPKGIAVQHAPAVELVRWVDRTFDVGPGDRLLFVTSLAFDLSVWDIFGVLGAGAALHIAPEEELRDPQRLVRLLREEPVTIWDSAPAALQQLAPRFPERAPEAEPAGSLRLVLLSGDWIPVSLPDRMRAAFPAARVVSLGGATEATVWSNWYPVGAVDPRWPSIPYGRPIANARYHVLDDALQPCPIGVPGDLLIGGRCLSVGYPGQPDLTAAQFIPDPFAAERGARLYRTGDRARHGRDGNLELLGRRDQQVKVRGFRIELGEIEVALARHPAVREAVAAVREETGDQRLVAYVVPGAQTPAPSTAELRAFLQQTLPEYMVPWTFVALDALPVTANGKLDRAALPAPPRRAAAAVAPRNALEREIAAAWREVLGLASIGVEENFFEAGGSSLLLGKLQARLRRSLGRDVPFVDLFRHPTIESLARSLAEAPAPAALDEEARARTDTRRERLRQVQQRRGANRRGQRDE